MDVQVLVHKTGKIVYYYQPDRILRSGIQNGSGQQNFMVIYSFTENFLS